VDSQLNGASREVTAPQVRQGVMPLLQPYSALGDVG
jgi:hypothetical protein